MQVIMLPASRTIYLLNNQQSGRMLTADGGATLRRSGQHAVRAEISCRPVPRRPQMALSSYCKMPSHRTYNASGPASSACQCRPPGIRL